MGCEATRDTYALLLAMMRPISAFICLASAAHLAASTW